MEKTKRKKSDLAAVIIMIVLAVILIPVLAVNLTLIIKGSIDPDNPPSVFGVAPLAVTSGSMEGDEPDSFGEGSLIFVRLLSEEEKQTLEEGDIVTFRASGSYVTHRIVSRNFDGETLTSVVTRGDANDATDGAIPLENIVGICTASAAGLGGFTMFLQTPGGILVFVGVPVLLFIIYDVTRIMLHNRRIKAESASKTAEESAASLAEKDEEIRRLRSLLENKEPEQPETDDSAPDDSGSASPGSHDDDDT